MYVELMLSMICYYVPYFKADNEDTMVVIFWSAFILVSDKTGAMLSRLV